MIHLAAIVQAAAPSLYALRSTTAKASMKLIQVCDLSIQRNLPGGHCWRPLTLTLDLQRVQELAMAADTELMPVMDAQLELLVPLLLKRSGEVSTAGRDNFLARTAEQVLQALAQCVSPSRFIMALLTGASHRSPAIRAKAASQLDTALQLYTKETGAVHAELRCQCARSMEICYQNASPLYSFSSLGLQDSRVSLYTTCLLKCR